MSITKQSTFDYEVRGDYKVIQIRERIAIMEDGQEISFKYHRRALMPDADISSESKELQDLCNALWTDAIKTAYKNSLTE